MTDGRLGQADDVELDMRALLGALGRAWLFLLALVLVVGVGLFVGLGFVTPRYTAETKILIERGESAITQNAGDTEEARSLLDAEGVASQVQRIDSRDLAVTVVDRLALGALSEFSAPTLLNRFNQWLATYGIGQGGTVSPQERVLARFADRLDVFSVDKTRVISIRFSSSDPALAARVTNAVADEYLALDRDAKRVTNSDAGRWLEAQIEDLRAKLQDAEAKVEAYRTKSGLFVTGTDANNSASLPQQRLTDLNTEYARLEVARAAAEARARTIREGLASGAAYNVPEVLDSQLIQRLREQQVTLRAQIAQASVTLLPAHPRIKELNAQLADFDAQTRREIDRILKGIEGEVATARDRQTQIGADLERAKTATAQSNDAEVGLRALQREATAERELLETYLSRYREVSSRQSGDYLPADARIISRASTPLEPSFPRKIPITAAATVAVLLLAIAFILIRELMSGRALRRIVFDAPPPPAAVPAETGNRWAEDADVRRLMPAEPSLAQAMPAEAQDSLRGLVDRIVETKAKRILVTLAESSGETRPLAAVSLARQLSRRGNRVLLVDLHADDADGRAMSAAEIAPGFSDLYAGDASFGQVIFRDRRSRVHLIPRGIKTFSADMVTGERFAALLDALDHTYEHVLIDADGEIALQLAPTAGAVILVTEQAAGDPLATKAHEALALVSPVEILLLVADPKAADEPVDSATAVA